MVMIANYQYGWTFFVPDIQKKFGWDRASIQWAFTLFVLFETWLVPIEGWFVDKYGPRIVVLVGGILCAIGWAINAQATTLNGYYLGMIIAGIGAGGVYGTCVGNALKWFPDKRGLAAGITAAGFGAGSALTVAPIQAMIKDSGFQTTFLYFGLGQGIIIVILAFFLFAPKAGQVPAVTQNANIIQSRRNYQPTEVIRQPIFWLMYFMFVIVGAGGLMVTANLKPIAVDWKVDAVPVTLMADDDDGGDVRGHHRSRPQRPDPPLLRLDLRHDRPREHHVHRVRHGRRRHLGACICWATIRSGS